VAFAQCHFARVQFGKIPGSKAGVRGKGSKLDKGRKTFKLVEATLQVAPNSGVQESGHSSDPREARGNLLADLESS
jgi:hypothetical protein